MNNKGHACAPRNADAVAWCLIGSVERVYNEGDPKRSIAIDRIRDTLGALFFTTDWNDSPRRTQQDVIDLLESISE